MSLISIVLFCLISETITGETSSENQSRPPNVIIFLADDLGYGDLSFTGHPTTVTNNIDKLAQNGKVLTNFYVTSPICSPSSNQDIIDQPVYFPTTSQRFLKQAKDFITKSHKDGSPFFLYLAFLQIHKPQIASIQYAGKSSRGDVGDAILEMDWMIGEVMSFIGTLGIGNKTMSWFTSDNGPELFEHEHGGTAGLLRCGKGTTWDGGVRVPTVVHWPGKINPGRSNALSSTLDMLPTISNIVGVKNENLTLDGMDLATVLFDDAVQSPRKFQALYPALPSQKEGPFAVIFNQYKAHFYTQGSFLSDNDNPDPLCRDSHNTTQHDPPLLFDLYKDPGERYDIGNQTKSREIIKTISEWRNKHTAEVVWMQSITKIEEDDMEPCCTNSNCSPYPKCCDCPSSSYYCDSEDTTC